MKPAAATADGLQDLLGCNLIDGLVLLLFCCIV